MEAKDLRIGNLVNDEGGFGEMKVESILKSTGRVYLHTLDEDYLADFAIGKIKPIPLTEDLLLRFGYSATTTNSAGKRYSQVVKGVFEADLTMTYWETTPDAGKIFRLDRQIKYVHQLQNLYFALTGSELEVKQTTEVNQ